jgi:RHS repeat-associated protein
VLATVSDRKLISTPSFYVADIVSLQDYYAFGMEMPERVCNAGGYRYGYNGKENDKETGWQDYGFRLYDKRICRFPSVDPLTKSYPELTPYQFASNTPIMAIDLDGLEAAYVNETNKKSLNENLEVRQKNVLNRLDYCKNVNPEFKDCPEWNKSTIPVLGWSLIPAKNIFEVRDDILKNGAPPIVYIQHHALTGSGYFSGPPEFDMAGDLACMAQHPGNKPFDKYDVAYYIHTEIEKKPASTFSYRVEKGKDFFMNSEIIKNNEWQTKKLELDAIYQIAQKIPKGGTLILAGCHYAEGAGEELFKSLSKLNPSINFIGNVKYTGSFNVDSPITSSVNNGEDNGWVEFKNGVKTNEGCNLTPQSDKDKPLDVSKPGN